MPLRTKLLLSLILIAIVPLSLSGLTAYAAATTSLNAVERDNLNGALDSVSRALDDIQSTLARNVQDNANWDDLHDQIAKEPTDQDWMKQNFGPDVPTSTVNTFNLDLFGIWRGADKLLFKSGRVDNVVGLLGNKLAGALASDKPQTVRVPLDKDIYMVSFASVRTSDGKDPNGIILMGRVLGKDDLAQIKALTGYDVALYHGLDQIAALQTQTVTPAPVDLLQAAQGQKAFNQSDPGVALAFEPIQDQAGTTIATAVVWRSRQAVTAAQTSIASTLAVWFVVAGVVALIVAVVLGRSIANPLLAMADRAGKMAAGDLSQRMAAPGQATDELGRLAEAFDEMATKVGERVTGSERETERLQAVDEYRLNLFTAITSALQSPLNTIQTHGENLGMSHYGSLTEPQQRSVSSIRRAAAIEKALLADLMDFARAQQHKLKLVPSRLQLDSVMRDVTDTIQQRYSDRQVKLTVKISPGVPPLFADRTRVEQILESLLSWTYDYSLAGGQVTIAAQPITGHVSIAISDTSNGLTADEQAHIFELFYHPAQSNQRDGRSAAIGLGLALVKVLVEQQGGTITLDAQPGRGNTFTFTLPTTN